MQNFFRSYKKLAGMTGTAATESPEFQNIYKLNVTVVPTNQTVRRTDESDVVFRTEEGILSWWKAFIFVSCHVSSLVHFPLYMVQNVVMGKPPFSLSEASDTLEGHNCNSDKRGAVLIAHYL